MLNNIQNLRALAAYAVVAYHCLIRFLHPADPLGRSYLDLPSGGVDLFFVISGFVMVHTTRDDETPAWFATKRIARIVPLYWLATFVVIALVVVRPWTFSGALLTPDSILASLFFVPHVDANGQAYPILGVGWTLNYEMMFYALFAMSLLLPRTYRLPGVIALISLVWLTANLSGDSLIAHVYANPILFEFAAGCVLAHALRGVNADHAFDSFIGLAIRLHMNRVHVTNHGLRRHVLGVRPTYRKASHGEKPNRFANYGAQGMHHARSIK